MQGSKTTDATIALFTDVGVLIKSRLQKAIPLPFSQYQALWFVAGCDKAGMQDVAKHFKITAPSATFLIEELVRGGYLARTSNRSDRRKVELKLTAKGIRTFKSISQKRAAVLDKTFRCLSESDRKALNRSLKTILEHA